jgi:hypothetical protein
VSFAAITLCVASQRVFIVVYFVIDSVLKLLDIPSYYVIFLSVPGNFRRPLELKPLLDSVILQAAFLNSFVAPLPRNVSGVSGLVKQLLNRSSTWSLGHPDVRG